MLVYLAEKFGAFLPTEASARAEVMSWLFWQMARVVGVFHLKNIFSRKGRKFRGHRGLSGKAKNSE